MDFESALRTELASISGLTSKVFPLAAFEGTESPFVIYSKSFTDYFRSFDGTGNMKRGQYELDVIAGTYAALQTLIKAVKLKCASFEGRVIGVSGPFVQATMIENITEMYEPNPKFYRANIEITVFYEEA